MPYRIKTFLPRFIDKQVRLGYTAFKALLFDTPDTACDGRKVSVGVCITNHRLFHWY